MSGKIVITPMNLYLLVDGHIVYTMSHSEAKDNKVRQV